MVKIYYTPPSDEAFLDLKEQCIALWKTMGSEPSYPEEKIGRIKDLKNMGDNFMYMFAMFDIYNQRIVGSKLKEETKRSINERLIDGGTHPMYLLD